MPGRVPGSLDPWNQPQMVVDGTTNLQVGARARPLSTEEDNGLNYYKRRVQAVWDAFYRAISRYFLSACVARTGQDFREFFEALLPGLKLAVEVWLGSVLSLGALAAIAGAVLSGGAAAVPCGLAGAEAGSAIGLAVLEWMGLGFVVYYVAGHLHESRVRINKGLVAAWESGGDPARVDQAAHEIADGLAFLASLALQGLVAYAAKEGMPKVKTGLRDSRVGAAVLGWIERNPILFDVEVALRKLEIGEKAPALVRQRVRVAIEFLRRKRFARYEDGWLRGIDFHNEVAPADLEPGTTIIRRQRPGVKEPTGNWFGKGGSSPAQSAIDGTGKEFTRWKVKRRIQVLKSKAAALDAKFRKTPLQIQEMKAKGVPEAEIAKALEGRSESPVYESGGGEQYLISDDDLSALERIP
jgi:hypothetical protein